MSARTRGMPRRTAVAAPTGIPFRWIAGGLLAVLVLAAIVTLLLTGGTSRSEPGPTVSVSGIALAQLPDSGADPAVGATIPTVSGRDLDGKPITIGPSGSPQVVLIVAHWCPHCQAEVPRLVSWLRTNALPNGATFVTLSTSISAARPNFPPSAWLEREGWTAPVLSDDAASTGLQAFGMGSFPGFVFVNSDGTVAARLTGELPVEQVAQIAAGLR
jgi:thiol-disulfide isomerase/thioredoxin